MKKGDEREAAKRQKTDGTGRGNTKLSKSAEVPEKPGHLKKRFGIDLLFFQLQPGCLLQEAELPATFQFTTHGLRTSVTFERVRQRPRPGQI